VREELGEIRHAGPGEAARREVAVTKSGPAPSRWTLRTIRASVDWLTAYTVSGVWRVLQACGLGLHPSWARLFSPDPDYSSKVRRRHRCLRDAARHPDSVMAVFLDEFGYQRWPEVAPTWGGEALSGVGFLSSQKYVISFSQCVTLLGLRPRFRNEAAAREPLLIQQCHEDSDPPLPKDTDQA
jgi:hypothetical protein